MLRKVTSLYTGKAIRQGLVVLADQGVMSLVTFLAGVLLARSASESEYAVYMLGWTLIHSVRGIQDALVNLPFTVYAPRLEAGEFRRYQGSAITHTLIFLVVVSLVAIFVFYLNDRDVSGDMYELIELSPLLLLLLVTFVLKDFLRNALLAQLKVWNSVRVNGAASIILLAAISAVFVTDKLSANVAYLLFSSAFGMTAVVIILQNHSHYAFDAASCKTHFRDNWRLGKWALAGNFAYIGSRTSYPWLILYFMDYKAVAAYYACLALAVAPGPILRGAGAYILPRMSHGFREGSKDNLVRLLKKSTLLLSVPYLLWLSAGILFSSEMLGLVYADKFNDYGTLFILLLIMTTIDFVSAPLTNALQVLENTRAITVSLVLGAVVTLLPGSLLISMYGLAGAGIAAILSMITTIAWRVYAFRKTGG